MICCMLLCLDQYAFNLLRLSNGVCIYTCVYVCINIKYVYIYIHIAVSWGSVVNDLKTHPHCEDAFVKIRPMRNPCSVNCHASHACEGALALCWWPLCRESGFAMRLRLPGPYPGNVSPEAVFATPVRLRNASSPTQRVFDQVFQQLSGSAVTKIMGMRIRPARLTR